MRTLFIAPQVPWPLDVGSKIRTYNLLKSYAALGPVTLACFAQDRADEDAARCLADLADPIHCIPLGDADLGHGKISALRHALQGLPRIVRQFDSVELAERITSLLSEASYDIMHVERLFMTNNVPAGPRAPAGMRSALSVLDIDDLESAKLRRSIATTRTAIPRRLALWLEYLKLRRYERSIVPRYDVTLVCSDHDKELVSRQTGSPEPAVFRNGVDLFDCDDEHPDARPTLVFFGALNYFPNEDAALYLHQSIFPLIKAAVGDARLVIAGRSPTEAILRLDNGDDVVVRGYIEDKRELYSECRLVVVPIRIGGGTRIKILEAMATRRAVVSTTIGSEGIDVTDGSDILLGDSPDEFARACIRVLTDAKLRRALGDAGRALVTQKYQWDSIRHDFIAAMAERRMPDSRREHETELEDI